jgi:TPR repeat protein
VGALGRACELGDMGACNTLGVWHRDGKGGAPIDSTRATKWFSMACDSLPAACDNLGSQMVAIDPHYATSAFRRGCESGKDSAATATNCYKLALSLEKGTGAERDSVQALGLFVRSCRWSVAPACYSAGAMERGGTSGDDLGKATDHFLKGCRLGETRACREVAAMYAEGRGVRKDPRLAAMFYDKACRGGESRSCANYGLRLLSGDGVAIDSSRGWSLLGQACRDGIEEGCVSPPSR